MGDHVGGDALLHVVLASGRPLGSSGLRVLLEARDHAHAHGGVATVHRPSATVRRVIEASGLDAVLIVTDPPD